MVDDLLSLEQMLQNKLVAPRANRTFKEGLKEKLIRHSISQRRRVVYEWLAMAGTAVVFGVAVYGMARIFARQRVGL